LAHGVGVVAAGYGLVGMWGASGTWLFGGWQRIAVSVALSTGALCCAAALVKDWRAKLHPATLRLLFVSVVVWAAAQWVLSARYRPVQAWLAAAAVLAGFAALRLAAGRAGLLGGRRVGHPLSRLAFHASLIVVLFELGLRGLAALTKNPLFGLVDRDERDVMADFAMHPGRVHLGFACNSAGHYDGEFQPGRGARDVVVSLADSFAVGVVPHAYHFTTVAERALPGVAVHNFGSPAIGPAGYYQLLTEQALPLRPDAVVVHLFVGNDIGDAARWRNEQDLAASILDRRNIYLIQIPPRLFRARGEPARLAEHTPFGLGDLRGLDAAGLRAAMPWLADPLQEPPMFSDEAFLAIEVERARLLQIARGRGLYAQTTAALAAMRQACGTLPFAVVLIPDEFQVEDHLWREVSARASLHLARDAPQRELTRWLADQGIPYVDLLPDLLAVPALADGRRHVYHLRDTHFNARGSAVAGRRLAELVTRLLAR
jgi:hypothetical protein